MRCQYLQFNQHLLSLTIYSALCKEMERYGRMIIIIIFFKAYISSASVLSLYGPVGNICLGYTRGHLMLCSHDSVLSIRTPV